MEEQGLGGRFLKISGSRVLIGKEPWGSTESAAGPHPDPGLGASDPGGTLKSIAVLNLNQVFVTHQKEGLFFKCE